MNRILSIGDTAERLDKTIAASCHLGDKTAEPEAEDLIPDVLESSATCFWAAHAAIGASSAQRHLRRSLMSSMTSLSRQICLLTRLRRKELESDCVGKVMNGLDDRL
ncbi:MAG: hypothetical protein IPK66_15565 [Rhodospirillales bacterium]|nr:hypothetical protein [Rhodospirillales bacterium]